MFDLKGHVKAESETAYPLYYPYPVWVEQKPAEIMEAAISTIRNVMDQSRIKKEQLLGIGLSSAMHSLICVDRKGNPLSNSITWADGRSNEQAENLKASTKGTEIYLKTGTPIHPMSPLPKLIWMKENNYDAYQNANRFLSIKEFLIYKLFGRAVVDYSVASATGMFDLRTLDWDEEALKLAGISKDQLSTPVPPTEIISGLPEPVASEMGIAADTPFVMAGSDGPLANLGIGAIEPGEVAITIGTSGAIRQFASQPETDTLQQTFCYAFSENLSILGGPINNGGIVLKWVKDLFHEKDVPFEMLSEMAESVPAGSGGLLFHPYLNGERAPIWNADARGNFFGVNATHKKEHFIRAAMEGVIFSIYQVGEALERLAGPASKIYASGGFARSHVWLQILADIFNQEVQVPISHQSSAWGAAWTALFATGNVDSLEDIKESIPMKETIKPNSDNHERYAELYNIYKGVGESLSNYFTAVADFQKKNSN
ncbi:gluconate kinase [Pseudalkalibacillus caeni]|uniref:Gluconate kinase n=2 Tax=Exobacillus caeni TaxID=2574798 RepID=A0A5R9F4M0_9BACL|nr:gluconate kinase [Pseudalkalibacillus caeni]